MPHGYKRIYKDIFYLRKAHFCPDCGTKLNKVAVSKVVHSRSPEAKDVDFRSGDAYMIGEVQFTWDELECPHCYKHLTVHEMKAMEGIDPSKTGTLEKVLAFIVAILVLAVLFLASR